MWASTASYCLSLLTVHVWSVHVSVGLHVCVKMEVGEPLSGVSSLSFRQVGSGIRSQIIRLTQQPLLPTETSLHSRATILSHQFLRQGKVRPRMKCGHPKISTLRVRVRMSKRQPITRKGTMKTPARLHYGSSGGDTWLSSAS